MFYKTTQSDVLAAWDQYETDLKKLGQEARKLEEILGCGGRALYRVDVCGRSFCGICFSGNERPFAPELWSVQRAVTGWSCEPRRSRIPAHLRPLANELAKVWREYRPTTIARADTLLACMGLDFSVTLFGSYMQFRVGDVVYIEAGIKPAAHMVEILSDEFYAAKRQAEASA